jgi:membrane protease YdiL (CAAX protease family)
VAVSPAAAALTFVALAVLVAGVWAWLITGVRAAITWDWLGPATSASFERWLQAIQVPPRLPMVRWNPRRSVPWAMIDLLLVVAVYIGASVITSTVLHRGGWLSAADADNVSLAERQALIVGNVAVSLLILAATLPLLMLRCGASLRDLGWSPRALLSDLRLGLIGFVMLAPPVYALQGLLVYFWQPSKHPLMEMFKEAPSTGFFVVLLISASIVAPLFEELMFRVLLQGFLEKAFSFRGEASELVLGMRWSRGEAAADSAAVIPAELADDGGTMAAAEASDENPYQSPRHSADADPGLADDGRADNAVQHDQQAHHGRAAWLPIAISSLIFALLHYSHGPDWIPLILLAAGMGYLYQRTHRIVPSLVVHASLNSLSMWGLWVSVFDAPPAS